MREEIRLFWEVSFYLRSDQVEGQMLIEIGCIVDE